MTNVVLPSFITMRNGFSRIDSEEMSFFIRILMLFPTVFIISSDRIVGYWSQMLWAFLSVQLNNVRNVFSIVFIFDWNRYDFGSWAFWTSTASISDLFEWHTRTWTARKIIDLEIFNILIYKTTNLYNRFIYCFDFWNFYLSMTSVNVTQPTWT